MSFKAIALGFAALASAGAASATQFVTNGSFEANGPGFIYNAGNGNTSVVGWTVYDVGTSFPLTWLTDPASGPGFVYNYVVSPDGGNALVTDGAPTYKSGIFQSISGLTVGAKYNLKFYWAGAQQNGFPGPTTDKFYTVSFGGESYSTAPAAGPQGGFQGWFTENHTFTATSTTQVLSFLSSGLPDGVPPFTIIDGISLTGGVPEAATWAMMIAGFGLVGAAARRRRSTVVAA